MYQKVLIIGAGASGIAAATHLLKNQFEDFEIVEAENRIGGRIHSVDFFDHCIELGAQWCHGTVGNKVYELVENAKILNKSNIGFSISKFFTGNGNTIDTDIGAKLFQICNSLSKNHDLLRNSNKSFADYFFENFYGILNDSINDEINIDALTQLLFFEYYKKYEMAVDGTNDLYDVSAKGLIEYHECEGNQLLEWGDNGYKTLLDILMERDVENSNTYETIQSKLSLNKIVKKINYVNDLIEVTYVDNSQSYHDHVICTVSLGVLKKYFKKLFEPELLEDKINAIEYLGFGSVNKIFLKFDNKWWDDDSNDIGLLWNTNIIDDFKEKYPLYFVEDKFWFEDIFHFYELNNNSNTLIGWIAGSDCDKICDLNDEELIAICTDILKTFTGRNVPKPIGILRSQWGSSKNFYGSYSYISIDTEVKKTSSSILAKPILFGENSKPKILFAGEATHPHFYSTVHGALETGIREAERLLNYLKKDRNISVC